MFFILALRAVLLLVNAFAAIKVVLTAPTASRKARSKLIDPKRFIQIQQVRCNTLTVGALKEAVLLQLHHTNPRSQQLLLTQSAHDAPSALAALRRYQAAFYADSQRVVCVGLVHQHAILHLHVPEDLLAGVGVDFRTLQKCGILIPGSEKYQLKEDITPPAPHEEPIYFKRFRLEIDIRVLFEANILIPGFEQCKLGEGIAPLGPHEESCNLKLRHAKAPRHIEFAPIEPSTEVLKEFQQAVWQPIGGIDLRERIAFYKNRVANGASHLHQQEDVPEGPDYVTHHMFTKAYQWKKVNQEHERDSQGVEEWLDCNPQELEKVLSLRSVAEEYRSEYPEDFERFFPGSLDFLDTSDNEEVAVEAALPLSSNPTSPSPSPALTFYSLSPALTSKLVPRHRRFSTDSGYLSGDDLEADGVLNDPATIYVVVTRKRWSDHLETNDMLAHEACVTFEEFIAKKATAISQSPPHLAWSATAEYGALEALGPLGYDQRLYGELSQSE